MKRIRIGTRGSALALWQARHVADRLRAAHADCDPELIIIQTQGDAIQNKPLGQIGGDGLFTKAIQDALLANQADVAVHSLKDLPTNPVTGLALAAVPQRAPVRDAFISRKFSRFDDLPHGARVATGSTRRRAFIRHRRPDLDLIEIRGNVDTRLRRVEESDLHGLILAEAGLVRLGLGDRITEALDPSWMLPAVGQGALGIECRADDTESLAIVAVLDDRATHQSVIGERALLLALGGGCQMPLGVQSVISGESLRLRAAVVSANGLRRLDEETAGMLRDARDLGQRLAEQLLARGARELLQ